MRKSDRLLSVDGLLDKKKVDLHLRKSVQRLCTLQP